jgi:hypothetical protein
MKRSLGLLLSLFLVVGCTDDITSGPAAAPSSGSTISLDANLQMVVFNVPGMT